LTEPGTTPVPQPPPPAPRYAPSGPSGPRASFGRRLVAILLDWIILGIAYGILVAIFGYDDDGTGPSNGLSFLIGIAYFTYFEGTARGQTPGKMALAIRVVDFNTGTSIGHGRAALRYVGRILSTIPCLLGYFWMLWDREKQTWHDKIANDVVVPVDAYPLP
jgi:uncharacterized RDD family membrane protein YckC